MQVYSAAMTPDAAPLTDDERYVIAECQRIISLHSSAENEEEHAIAAGARVFLWDLLRLWQYKNALRQKPTADAATAHVGSTRVTLYKLLAWRFGGATLEMLRTTPLEEIAKQYEGGAAGLRKPRTC